MMTTKKASKQQIVWMRDATPAMRQDWVPAPAQTQGRVPVVRVAHHWLQGCRRPAAQYGLVIDSRSGEFCTACIDNAAITKDAFRQFAHTASPDLELMSFLGAQWEPFEQIHDVKTLIHAPDCETQPRFLIRAASTRGRVWSDRPDAERVANEVQRRRVVSAKRDLVASCRPGFAVRISVLRTNARQYERAFAVCEAGQPVAKRRVN